MNENVLLRRNNFNYTVRGGGGRDDGLMAELGGQSLSGVGFGIGVDRTLLACRAEGLEVAPARRVEVFGVLHVFMAVRVRGP